MNMKRVFVGLGLLAHGLAHALPGAQAGAAGTSWLLSGDGMGPGAVRWLVALLSAVAMSGFSCVFEMRVLGRMSEVRKLRPRSSRNDSRCFPVRRQ